jgi:hypothetical protein
MAWTLLLTLACRIDCFDSLRSMLADIQTRARGPWAWKSSGE